MIVVVNHMGFGILIPILPLYAESFGASEAVIGVLLASYAFMQFFSSPILGNVSDRYGRRSVILVSVAGSSVAWVLFGVADSLVMLFAARMILGALTGMNVAAKGYVADITTAEERAGGMGLVSAAYSVGFIFGPAAGAFLSSTAVVSNANDVLPAILTVTKFTLPCFAAAAISLVNFSMAYVWLPETRDASDDYSTPGLASFRRAVTEPWLQRVMTVFFCMTLAYTALTSMYVLYTSQTFGFGTTTNGYLLAYYGVVLAAVEGGVVGYLTSYFDDVRLTMFGAALMAVALISFPLSPLVDSAFDAASVAVVTTPVVVLGVVTTGIAAGYGITSVTLSSVVSNALSADSQGQVFGVTRSTSSLAAMVGPSVAGVLYSSVGRWAPFVFGGLLMLFVVGVSANLKHADADGWATGSASSES